MKATMMVLKRTLSTRCRCLCFELKVSTHGGRTLGVWRNKMDLNKRLEGVYGTDSILMMERES